MTNEIRIALMALYEYDKERGVFIRKTERGLFKPGTVAGYVAGNGYVYLSVGGRKRLLAHRVAWLFMTGAEPDGHIDHIDGDRTNNAIVNLRVASRAINAQNRRNATTKSKTGLLGATPNGDVFRAQIGVGGKSVYIGVYPTAELAHTAYVEAKRRLHVGCTI